MKKLLVLVFAIALCLGVLCLGASAADDVPVQDSNGVYQIGTAEELYWFAEQVNSGKTNINAVLTANITINEDVLNAAASDNTTDLQPWTPIGTDYNKAYTGTFDGQGHTISGLYYDGDDYQHVGLFGYVYDGGHVQNVNIADSYISNSYSGTSYIGGVCGRNWSGDLTNCSFDGSVTGTGTYTGGVCGDNGGTITNCRNTGSVTSSGNGTNYVGGVCGYNSVNDGTATIENCYNTGSVTGYYVGGVCGRNDGGTITNCYWLTGNASSGIGISSDGTATSVEDKSTTDFASGEVAWLLNSNQENGPWRQTIGTDAFPVLDSTHKEVFQVMLDEADYYCNKSFTFPEAPSKPSYTFLYWSDSNNMYEAGDGVTITADTKFTAVWREINIPDPNSITVTQPANGTIRVNPSNGSAGTLITVTATPDDGYELAYITVDGEKISGNTFRMPDKAVTVSAVFVPVSFPFVDVHTGDWFYDYVAYVYSNGLMDGTSAASFEPNANMTRAMVWAILARAEGVDTDGGATWYAKAQEWVVAKGISDGENPSAAITRQELVTMLWRLSGEPVVNYALTAPDADAISGWAYEAMRWAVSEGIIEGDDLGNLNPTANSTRAHAAAFMQRFCTAL